MSEDDESEKISLTEAAATVRQAGRSADIESQDESP